MVAARATKARARRQRQGGDSTGHEPVNQSPCLDQDLFLSCCRLAALPSPDFRLFGSFFAAFGFPFWKTHLGAFLSSVKNPD